MRCTRSIGSIHSPWSSKIYARVPYRPVYPHPRILFRSFRTAASVFVVKPFLLADIGEGIRECEVIQWFVEPEARVEQFDKLCEVQSDKASVEITSRYDGIIKKLHYQAGEMAIVGKPLVDIDLAGEVTDDPQAREGAASGAASGAALEPLRAEESTSSGVIVNKHHSLATPAVRRLIREIGVTITDVVGTGKDGRVLKEDVAKFVAKGALTEPRISTSSPAASRSPTPSGQEETVALTPVQQQMFKTMTQSLAIPHFLYADEVVLDPLMRIKSSLNKTLVQNSPDTQVRKLTFMPFFIKALSLALEEYPLLNSHLDLSQPKPRLTRRPQHNIGVAMDTPAGLLVPSIKNVRGLSILDIAIELQRLQQAGAAGKLTPADLTGGTITMSNIGNIGGTVTAPVIVPNELAIVGIGRARTVPSFGDAGEVVPKTIVNLSWSADHRVVDGATMARMAALLREYIQEPEMLLVRLK